MRFDPVTKVGSIVWAGDGEDEDEQLVHFQGAIDGPICCTQLPAAWRNRTGYTTPRAAFEAGNCFVSCDQNPDCPAASARWAPGSCQTATSGSGGSHPRSNFTVKHGSCSNKPDSECCTNWCTF